MIQETQRTSFDYATRQSGTRRVCHLTTVHPRHDTRILLKECRTLAKAGYDVHLIVGDGQGDTVIDRIHIHDIGAKPDSRIKRMCIQPKRALEKILALRPDIVHFHDPELIPVGLLLRIQGKVVFYDIHEDVPQTILSKDYIPNLLRKPIAWLIERVENLACRWFSALMPATPAIAKRFTTLNPNNVVVQNFPLLEEMVPAIEIAWNQRSCSVAYVGGIAINRGIREMVEAMGFLPARLNARLKLAGNFSPVSDRDEVVRLPGWNRTEELGFLDRSKIAGLLGSVRGGVVLFHPLPNHIAAQPNKLFEYMSAGIPVIASDFPLWRQIIESAGCGLLVNPLDPKAIARSIEYVLTHPKEAEDMGRRGREAVEKCYNWENESRKLLTLYTF